MAKYHNATERHAAHNCRILKRSMAFNLEERCLTEARFAELLSTVSSQTVAGDILKEVKGGEELGNESMFIVRKSLQDLNIPIWLLSSFIAGRITTNTCCTMEKVA
jgi:hypothetical protein